MTTTLIHSGEAYGTTAGHGETRGEAAGPLGCEAHVLARLSAIEEKLSMLVRAQRKEGHVLLSLRETARRLGIDRSTTLAELLRAGRLRVVMKNGRAAVPASEIERIEREGFTTAPKELPPRRRRTPGANPGDAIRGLAVRHAHR